MTTRCFLCDPSTTTAPCPPAQTLDPLEELRFLDGRPALTIDVSSLPRGRPGVDIPVLADLIRLAGYVYAADQRVPRHRNDDATRTRWHRRMVLFVPVSNPVHWNQANHRLTEVLAEASDDTWEFHFGQVAPGSQTIPLHALRRYDAPDRPNAVHLFSGGIDSLAAAVDAARAGSKPFLVSHESEGVLYPDSGALARALAGRGLDWYFPHAQVRIGLKEPTRDAREAGRRTTPFVLAALGAVAAGLLGLTDVVLASNGVTSLDRPLHSDWVGTAQQHIASPAFLRKMNAFLRDLLPHDTPQLRNPLQDVTRAEVLEALTTHQVADLVEKTVSCMRPPHANTGRVQCGTCLSCIQRRLTLYGVDLHRFDPPDRYQIDIVQERAPERGDRARIQAYLRVIEELRGLHDDEIALRYAEALACDGGVAVEQAELVQTKVDLLNRHAHQLDNALTRVIQVHAVDIRRRGLQPGSLLDQLMTGTSHGAGSAKAGMGPAKTQRVEVAKEPEEAVVVRVDGHEQFRFAWRQGKAVFFMYEEHQRGREPVPTRAILKAMDVDPHHRLGSYFKRGTGYHEAWDTFIVHERKGLYRLELDADRLLRKLASRRRARTLTLRHGRGRSRSPANRVARVAGRSSSMR